MGLSLSAHSIVSRELLARIEEAHPEVRLPSMHRLFGALAEDIAPHNFDTGFNTSIAIILRGLEGIADDVAAKDAAKDRGGRTPTILPLSSRGFRSPNKTPLA